ncbi:hypothetical protein A5821_001843 [Enterococcus sp. 7F3_DIV0205]|uniref:Uncharacterized protein n=1 Tax=Candidatus Enterococcus palustris TaxID=1834189 RepID=A0AAQ3Y7J3_9ENTE|nr:hypothetical protein [Enterococcus sp. 7F3_DIV0205]OTN86236.1 hypothetical protein A5821_002186 [Enterococcus sp. 7F3_DIV0205]
MKKWVKIFSVLTIVGMVLGGLFYTTNGNANEESAYIPDPIVRETLIKAIEASEENLVVENELPTISQLEKVNSYVNVHGEQIRSLEGMEYLKNVKELQAVQLTNVMDYRPIGGMTSLEWINLYQPSANLEGINETSLSFVKNLKNLQGFHAANFNTFDLTPFNELDNVTLISVMGDEYRTDIPQIISKSERKVNIVNPVKLSKQFEGALIEVEASDEQRELAPSYKNEIITIPDVNLESSSVTVRINANKNTSVGEYNYSISFNIPLKWQD